MTRFQDFTMQTIDGETRPLSDFAGKACLVVNVASKCGKTPQYAGLQRLYEANRERGVEVLGFPCNQFGGQEPGSADEIVEFCTINYGVSFPLFAKIDVNGAARDPLYAWLTAQDTRPEGPGDISWNFGKFVIGKDGQVVARFTPDTDPESAEVLEAIESAL